MGRPLQAQVVSNQLSTQVNSNPFGHVILGGDSQQSNLFHSFSEIDTTNGQFINFVASPDITNVISRATDAPTHINGLVTVTSDGSNLAPDVNLFLLSPQGISFGSGAITNIDGAFVASTAEGLRFEDNTVFEANTNTPAMLTVSIPVGLQMGKNPSAIQVQGINNNLPSFGINSLLHGQNIVLVGGDIEFSEGNVLLLGGRLQAAGLSEAGNVQLSIDKENGFLRATLPAGVARADVRLTDGAQVITNGPGESISINAHNLTATSNANATNEARSSLLSGTLPGFPLPFQSGDINIDATGSVRFLSSNIYNLTSLGAVGDAGGISVQAESVFLTGGAQIGSFRQGSGNVGDVNITATDSVIVDGADSRPSLLTGLYSLIDNVALAGKAGEAGDMNIKADSLSIINGALVSVSTLDRGNAGNLSVNANRVLIEGTNDIAGLPSSISSSVEFGAIGNGGNVDIVATELTLDRGGAIVGRTQGDGNAGAIVLSLENLEVLGGGQIVTTSFTQGAAGNIDVDVRDHILLSGSDPTYSERVTLSLFNILGDGSSGIFANTASTASGSGGDVTVKTGNLLLADTAQLSVSSLGTGAAGSLEVSTLDRVSLSRGSRIQAESRGGSEGNVAITTPVLLLRDGAQVSTNATETATGGNIVLNTPLIVGLGNSDIVARASQGAGGNIDIRSSGLFGIAPRPTLTNGNDINASSDLGLDGTVAISSPSVDPDNGLVELPTVLADADNELTAGCSVGQNQFIATGRGGLPINPAQAVSSNSLWRDLRPVADAISSPDNQVLGQAGSARQLATVEENLNIQPVEASTWHRSESDEVVLLAASSVNFEQGATCMSSTNEDS